MKLRLAALLILAALPARADDLKPFCAERPGKDTPSCILDEGHAQVELGLFDGAFRRRAGVTTDDYAWGDPQLRYGVSDRLEVSLDLPLYQSERVHSAAGTSWQHGLGDLVLGAKYALRDGEGFGAAVNPLLKLPTAGGGLGNGAAEGGFIVPLDWDLGEWSVSLDPELDILRDGSGNGYHTALANVISLGRDMGGGFSLGAELWTQQEFDPAGTVSQYSVDLDGALMLGADTQLDAGINWGLNRATPDAEFYFGVSRRF
jgi:hypothetical protein